METVLIMLEKKKKKNTAWSLVCSCVVDTAEF